MPPSEGIQWACAGTKRISIADEIDPPSDGLVSVYRRRPPPRATDTASGGDDGGDGRSPASRLSGGSGCGDDDDCLHVVITDGAHTFYERRAVISPRASLHDFSQHGRIGFIFSFFLLFPFAIVAIAFSTHSIPRRAIRHMGSEEGRELERVASILLRPDDETFRVSYKRAGGQLLGGSRDSTNTTSVKVSVRKTCLNNIVRPVWEGALDDICHSRYDDLPLFARNALPPGETDRSDSSSGLSFSVMLGDAMNRLHREIDALRGENERLEANALRWKSTSDKLTNRWETEKSELTDRFLTLFNEHKARHIETQKELDQLKGKRQRTGETNGSGGGICKSDKETLEIPDHEDEHDYAEYDREMVDRLAAGPPSSGHRSSDDRKPRALVRRQNRENCLSQSSGFVNPHTGAMEFGNAQEIFSSDEDDNMEA